MPIANTSTQPWTGYQAIISLPLNSYEKSKDNGKAFSRGEISTHLLGEKIQDLGNVPQSWLKCTCHDHIEN